ncbi:MAG: hypothetical protein SGARI_004086, partial [Bacillariaceae sp.]
PKITTMALDTKPFRPRRQESPRSECSTYSAGRGMKRSIPSCPNFMNFSESSQEQREQLTLSPSCPDFYIGEPEEEQEDYEVILKGADPLSYFDMMEVSESSMSTAAQEDEVAMLEEAIRVASTKATPSCHKRLPDPTPCMSQRKNTIEAVKKALNMKFLETDTFDFDEGMPQETSSCPDLSSPTKRGKPDQVSGMNASFAAFTSASLPPMAGAKNATFAPLTSASLPPIPPMLTRKPGLSPATRASNLPSIPQSSKSLSKASRSTTCPQILPKIKAPTLASPPGGFRGKKFGKPLKKSSRCVSAPIKARESDALASLPTITEFKYETFEKVEELRRSRSMEDLGMQPAERRRANVRRTSAGQRRNYSSTKGKSLSDPCQMSSSSPLTSPSTGPRFCRWEASPSPSPSSKSVKPTHPLDEALLVVPPMETADPPRMPTRSCSTESSSSDIVTSGSSCSPPKMPSPKGAASSPLRIPRRRRSSLDAIPEMPRRMRSSDVETLPLAC